MTNKEDKVVHLRRAFHRLFEAGQQGEEEHIDDMQHSDEEQHHEETQNSE